VAKYTFVGARAVTSKAGTLPTINFNGVRNEENEKEFYMSNRKKPNRKKIDVLESIVSMIELHQKKQLPAIEGALDPKVRRRLSPDEEKAERRYNQCFDRVRKALKSDKQTIRWLFELDNASGWCCAAQADVSRAVGIIYGAIAEAGLRRRQESSKSRLRFSSVSR
jgi:hypothetical protein